MRLIDADELKRSLWAKIREEEVPKGEVGEYILEDFIEMVAHFPTAEKRGRWEADELGYASLYTCSVCGHRIMHGEVPEWNYCPNCGSRMVNEDE